MKTHTTSPRILVLGAKGMLGHTVFAHLKQIFPGSVWGTDRTDKDLLFFDAKNPEKSYANIKKKIGKVDYVINCIALLKNAQHEGTFQNYIEVNSILSHKLARFAEEDGWYLIHVSTDSVFADSAGVVDESTVASPEDVYSWSKYLGEPHFSQHALTIRTSVIGMDPNKHKGLLEWVMSCKDKEINGYTNHLWSGCTTLQFAQLCSEIIKHGAFTELREGSSVYHFAPLGPVSKYQVVKEWVALVHSQTKVNEATARNTVSRLFKTKYKHPVFQKCVSTLQNALAKLLRFERPKKVLE